MSRRVRKFLAYMRKIFDFKSNAFIQFFIHGVYIVYRFIRDSELVMIDDPVDKLHFPDLHSPVI